MQQTLHLLVFHSVIAAANGENKMAEMVENMITEKQNGCQSAIF